MTIVVDASVAVVAALAGDDLSTLHGDVVAPALMWSEARSALHELLWRDEVSRDDAVAARLLLEASGGVALRTHPLIGETAWEIAERFGWAKTYDAEYVALAQLLECRLVTLDARLRRATARLGFVVSPDEVRGT